MKSKQKTQGLGCASGVTGSYERTPLVIRVPDASFDIRVEWLVGHTWGRELMLGSGSQGGGTMCPRVGFCV
jgi:hypothetical protein